MKTERIESRSGGLEKILNFFKENNFSGLNFYLLRNAGMKGKRCFQFTLVELLVVIAVIAILASLLLPAVMKSRDKAKTILCKSALRQTGQLIYSYLQDHQEYFPSFTEGSNSPYTAKMIDYVPNPSFFTCPSSSEEEITYQYSYRLWRGKYWPVTLALSYYLGYIPGNVKNLKVGEISNPSRAVIVGDAISSAAADKWATYYYGIAPLNSAYRSFRHEGNHVHNYLYLSGDVHSIKGTNSAILYTSYSYYYYKNL